MTVSFAVPMWVVWKGPAVVLGGAFRRRGDVVVGVVRLVVQSLVTSVTAARAAFSSTMALSAA